jgi:hypothetical protein
MIIIISEQKQLPVWYSDDGSVQHEVPFELMSLSMAESF